MIKDQQFLGGMKTMQDIEVEVLSSKNGEKIEARSKQKNLEEICDIILNMDQKIRFVQIAVRDKTFTKINPELASTLTPEETEEYIDDSLLRWETRKKLAPKLGEPIYGIVEYKNGKRITIPVKYGGLIGITLDPAGFHEVIIKKISEIKDMINRNL
jgi:hypothetical protein